MRALVCVVSAMFLMLGIQLSAAQTTGDRCMISTVGWFMNKFRKLSFIDYNGTIKSTARC